MTDNTQQEHSAARDSVIRGTDVQNEVRNIVVDALSNGKMDPEHIKEVVRSVFQGAIDGASTNVEQSKQVLEETIHGVDDALTQVAQASKLAIEEAVGNIKDYSEHDLKRALTDMNDLEGLFFQTLSEVAKAGQETTSNILSDLLHHAQKSSTSVGQTINEASDHLQSLLNKAGTNIHAADAAKSTGASLARMASGFLEGIADSLSPKEK